MKTAWCGSLAACFLAVSVSELVGPGAGARPVLVGVRIDRRQAPRDAARLLPGAHDVLDDPGVDPQVLGDVRDRLAVAVELVGPGDPAVVVVPVVNDLLPAGRFGNSRLGGDPERKHGQGGNQHGDGSGPGGSDSSKPTYSGA